MYYYCKDVWKSTSSCTTWSLVTANAPWSARAGHGAVVVGSTIVLFGGCCK